MSDKKWKTCLGLLAGGWLTDQLTKLWAMRAFALPGGEAEPWSFYQVVGDWVVFRLVYNEGAAFSLQPHRIIGILPPTVFYGLITSIALIALVVYFVRLQAEEWPSQVGIALIASGALGNLTDRLRLGRVVDFIDVGIPAYPWRWPTFNVADSMVCVGVGFILLAPWLQKRLGTPPVTPASPNG